MLTPAAIVSEGVLFSSNISLDPFSVELTSSRDPGVRKVTGSPGNSTIWLIRTHVPAFREPRSHVMLRARERAGPVREGSMNRRMKAIP
eukprot:1320737-Amorphochlora_amoeboformis.AAC.1